METPIKTVTIPACESHEGIHKITIKLLWICPACGGPRGTIRQKRSYDGSLNMLVDSWDSRCRHIDKYASVRNEALANGLNLTRVKL